MLMLELFSGSKVMSDTFKAHGWDVVTVDYNEKLEPDFCLNVYDILDKEKIKEICNGRFPDVIWASPDCTTYSLLQIMNNRYRDWNGFLKAKSEYAEYCDIHNEKLVNFLKECGALFFIENPRAGMRGTEFMFRANIPRYTVTYCQYGHMNQKPTDIWTNHPNPNFKPACGRGSPCHIPSPRGTHNGIQGQKDSFERAIIPKQLCEHIVKICEEYYKVKS